LAETIPLYEQTLTDYEWMLGADHPTTRPHALCERTYDEHTMDDLVAGDRLCLP
jgi:hypothetical protein